MSFLKKIINRIHKGCNSGFNLKRYNAKFAAYGEEEGDYLPEGFSTLSDFDEGRVAPQTPINATVEDAMRRYIVQNANTDVPNPIPTEWLQDPEMQLSFQNIARKILGNMSEAFVSRVLQNTFVDENPNISTDKGQEKWEDTLDFQNDLVATFHNNPERDYILQNIAKQISRTERRKGQGVDFSSAYGIATEAVDFALGAPIAKKRGGTRRDQRFNYFLNNPDKMPQNVAYGYNEFLLSNPDINLNKNPDLAIDYLKTNYGQELMNVLEKNIVDNDPSIPAWILKQEGQVKSDDLLGVSMEKGENDDYSMKQEDLVSKNISRIEQREKDWSYIESQTDEVKKAAAAVAREYLGQIQQDMQLAVGQSIEKSYDKSKNLQDFNSIERLTVYLRQLFSQYQNIFKDNSIKPKVTKEGSVVFENNNGKIVVPKEQLGKIFQGDLHKPTEELYKEIKQYRESNAEGEDILDWFKTNDKGIVSYKTLMEAYKDIYNVKKYILSKIPLDANDQQIQELAASPTGPVVKSERDQILIENIDAFSNVLPTDNEQQILSKRYRFIKLTLDQYAAQQMGDADVARYNNLYRDISSKVKDKVNPDTEDSGWYRSLRANAQNDVFKIMDELLDTKEKGVNDNNEPFKTDVFKGFLGALNPHSRIREFSHKDVYNSLMGKDKDESSIDLNSLDKKVRIKLTEITMRYNAIMRAKATKQNFLDKLEEQYNKQTQAYNAKILKKIDRINKKRENTGEPLVLPEEYVGVEGWTGDSALSPQDYARIAYNKGVSINKASKVLTDLLSKMRTLKERVPADDSRRVDIREYGLNYVSQKLEEVKNELSDFKKQHKLSSSQIDMVIAESFRYLEKISSIENIKNNYKGLKLAFNFDFIDNIKRQIKDEYEKAIDVILYIK